MAKAVYNFNITKTTRKNSGKGDRWTLLMRMQSSLPRYGNQYESTWRFKEPKPKPERPCNPAIPFQVCNQQNLKKQTTVIYTSMFIAALFITAKLWILPRHPSRDGWIKTMCIQ